MRNSETEAKLNKILRPECRDGRILFIRHESAHMGYDWLKNSKPEVVPLRPDILIAFESGIQEFATDQIRLRKIKDPAINTYDPSQAPLKCESCRVMFNAVLSCFELKWDKKVASNVEVALTGPSEATSCEFFSQPNFQPFISACPLASQAVLAKRKTEPNEDTRNGKEPKTSETATPNNEGNKRFQQMGNYASEFLSRAPGILHMIGFVVRCE